MRWLKRYWQCHKAMPSGRQDSVLAVVMLALSYVSGGIHSGISTQIILAFGFALMVIRLVARGIARRDWSALVIRALFPMCPGFL